MNNTVHEALPKIGENLIDTEHDLQMQMLDSLSDAIERGGEFAAVKHILEQFIEFSDMHFLSEQLVMRLHSYPGYESHLAQHTRLMKKVRDLREKVFGAEKEPSLELIKELRAWLLNHIASEDLAFGEFLRRAERRNS